MLHHTSLRSALLLVGVVAIIIGSPLGAAEDSPISSNAISSDNSAAAIAAAKVRGATTASRDIAAGTLRILYYGKPWSAGKPLVDDATGYRVQLLAGCVVTEPFVAEVEAYNSAMREWHAKQAASSTHR
jgi:hypothetical protein